MRLHEVALRLDAAEIFGEGVRVGRALLVGVQQQPVFEPVDVGAVGEERHLPEFAQQLGVVAVAHRRGYLLHDALAHAVDQQVGTAVDEDRGFERILPVVVVGEPPQRRFDAAHHHRRAGIEPLDLQSPEPVEHLCGKCENYAAEWDATADKLWEEGHLIKVDSDEYKELHKND